DRAGVHAAESAVGEIDCRTIAHGLDRRTTVVVEAGVDEDRAAVDRLDRAEIPAPAGEIRDYRYVESECSVVGGFNGAVIGVALNIIDGDRSAVGLDQAT